MNDLLHQVYEKIIEDLSILVCRFDPGNAVLTFVNNAFCICFNKDREALVNKSFLDLIPVQEHGWVRQYHASLGPDLPLATSDLMVLTPSGPRW